MTDVANLLFDDRPSGPVYRVSSVAGRLRSKGIETTMLVPKGSGVAEDIAADHGVACSRLQTQRLPPLSQPLRIVSWLPGALRDVLAFRAFFVARGFDIVHVNGAAYFPPAIAARLARLPLVWHLNDTALSPRLAVALGSMITRIADVVVVAADAVGNHYGIPRCQRHIIPAPVDIERFAPSKRTRSEGVFRVGHFGNWNPLKDHKTLLRAIARLRALGVPARAVLAGARLDSHVAYARSVDAAIRELELTDIVEELGYVQDVPELMRTMDAVVISSRSEASPMALLEAMAAGVPVVATDVGGVREILGIGGQPLGTIVPVGDDGAICDALLGLYDNPEAATTIAMRAREAVEQHFSLDECVSKHVAVYDMALGARNRAHSGNGLFR